TDPSFAFGDLNRGGAIAVLCELQANTECLGEEVENFDARISRSSNNRSVAWDGIDPNLSGEVEGSGYFELWSPTLGLVTDNPADRASGRLHDVWKSRLPLVFLLRRGLEVDHQLVLPGRR